jgi:hypothetical protein
MANIHLISDAELQRWVRELTVGGDAYVCAMDELSFRERHPEYRVA